MKNNENHEMAEYRKCVICGGVYKGVGNACPGCEAAMKREPVKVGPRDPKDVLADISREVEARAKVEFVADILVAMRKLAGVLHKKECVEGYEIVDAWSGYKHFADRLEKAHKRELDALVEASVRTNGLLAKQVNEKDTEIVKLRALVKGLYEASSTECAYCGYDCGRNRENCIMQEAVKYLNESEVVK